MKENSDGSDTNVGSIGNSIEDRINNAYFFLNSMHSDFRTGLYYKEDLENLEHILSDYKRVLKENKELKNDYENLSNSVVVKNYYIENSIPVQKVKDKIEEEKLPLVIVGGRRNKRTLEYGIKLGRRQALQELLEKE